MGLFKSLNVTVKEGEDQWPEDDHVRARRVSYRGHLSLLILY